MDSSQLLNQLLGTGSSGSASQALGGMQTEIAWLFWLGLIASVVLTIAFLVYLVFKMRVQSAILRIDKNLQKLVEFQVPAAEKVTSTDEKSDKKQHEQN